MAVLTPAVNQTMVFFLAQQNKAPLAVLSEPLQAGKITPVIDRTYALNKAAEAKDTPTGRPPSPCDPAAFQ
jgi:NADPH:quinone reductase-like Zn-dependent oxidoreductase